MNYYWSDPHFTHANIIRLCERPFASVEHMNTALLHALRLVNNAGAACYCLGDFGFDITRLYATYGGLRHPARHTLVAGNHDGLTKAKHRPAYTAYFGITIGTEKTWQTNHHVVEDTVDGRTVRVRLTHAPVEDLHGCDYALYGHIHNGWTRSRDAHERQYPWIARSPAHFNVSVEVLDYRPWTLQALVDARRYNPEAFR